MGSTDFYADEGPVREVTVAPFSLERHPVTNDQFAQFIEDTGHVTVAERALDPADFPGVPSDALQPGGLVFTPTAGPVPLDQIDQWWRWVPGATWREPRGPGSSIGALGDHPVVMVAHEDADAYAAWAGRRLPTEAELELAAWGGRAPATFAWGEDVHPVGRLMANTWQGDFPWRNTGALGWSGTSPVGAFPANDDGFVDLIGNVWEWTSTYYVTGADRDRADEIDESSCCTPRIRERSVAPGERLPRRVLKGGSHLCAPEYCLRYRPAARSPQSIDSATTHVGFRCAADPSTSATASSA